MDKAHKLTDEKLEEIEKKLSKIYSSAQKDIQQKADEYFKKFEADDMKKRNLLEKGEITDEQYRTWRSAKIAYGKRFTALKKDIANQLLNVNQTAVAYVNGTLPEIYSLNYNALKDQVDGIGGYSFTLVDPDTVKNLSLSDSSILPYKKIDPLKDIPWNMKNINAEVLQGIIQGESIPKISSRIMNVQKMNERAAVRTARTIVTGAENKGRQDSYARAEADGIILQKEWLATNDGRTRHSHAMLDGAIVNQDKKFDNGLMYPGDPSGRPEEVYNCFVGETKVASDSDVVRSYKHKYNGEIISIKTAGGVQFSCTPNHPILTPNGWIAAELLNNGDNILVTFGEQNVFGGVNPDIKHRFPRIDAIHNLFNVSGGERAVGVSVDFHGDVATSNVEIVTQKRLLWNVGYSSRRNGLDKFPLKFSNKTFSCFGSLFKHFCSVCKTSFGFIGSKCKSLSFFKCGVSHSCEHGFGTIANRDSVLTEYSINDLPADTVIDGELLDRLSCKVFLDTIVNVDAGMLSTHVYNLQTENGYYFVNSIIPLDKEKSNGIFAIAKNCRCTLVAKVNGFKKAQVQKAMAEKQAEEQQASAFTPAKTTAEAEAHAKEHIFSGAYLGKTSYKGIDVDMANGINETLERITQKYGRKLSGVEVVNPKTAKGLKALGGSADAPFATNSLNGMVYINKDIVKNAKALKAYTDKGDEAFRLVMANKDKLSGKMRVLAEIYEKAGKDLVDSSLEGMITHEYGHYLAVAINPKADVVSKIADGMGDHLISGYSQHNVREYLAECFTEYERGDRSKLDPIVIELFEGAIKR